jgi:lipid A 3-O-deacylase
MGTLCRSAGVPALRDVALPVLLLVLSAASPAQADEVFVGAYRHGVDTPFTLKTGEKGTDIAAGYRFDPVLGPLQPYVIASLNSRGDTSFAATGMAWTIGKGRVYLRPAAGLAIHDGPRRRTGANGRATQLGSRVLFEPEIGLGYRASNRLSIEANWMHLSHARLFNAQQNPGIDMIGMRLNWKLR